VVVVAAVLAAAAVVVAAVIWRFSSQRSLPLPSFGWNLFHYPEGGGSRFLQKLASARLHGVTYHTTAGLLFMSRVY